jgi:hypothetical protein
MRETGGNQPQIYSIIKPMITQEDNQTKGELK